MAKAVSSLLNRGVAACLQRHLAQQGMIVTRRIQPLTLGSKVRLLGASRGSDVKDFCAPPSQQYRRSANLTKSLDNNLTKKNAGADPFPFPTKGLSYHAYMSNKKAQQAKKVRESTDKLSKISSFGESLRQTPDPNTRLRISKEKGPATKSEKNTFFFPGDGFKTDASKGKIVDKTSKSKKRANQAAIKERIDANVLSLKKSNANLAKPGAEPISFKELLAGRAFVSSYGENVPRKERRKSDGDLVSDLNSFSTNPPLQSPKSESSTKGMPHVTENGRVRTQKTLSKRQRSKKEMESRENWTPKSWLELEARLIALEQDEMSNRGEGLIKSYNDKRGFSADDVLVDGSGISQSFSNTPAMHWQNETKVTNASEDTFWTHFDPIYEPKISMEEVDASNKCAKTAPVPKTSHEPLLCVTPQEIAKGRNSAKGAKRAVIGDEVALVKDGLSGKSSKSSEFSFAGVNKRADDVKHLHENLLDVTQPDMALGKRLFESRHQANGTRGNEMKGPRTKLFSNSEMESQGKRKSPKIEKTPSISLEKEKEELVENYRKAAKAHNEATRNGKEAYTISAPWFSQHLNATPSKQPESKTGYESASARGHEYFEQNKKTSSGSTNDTVTSQSFSSFSTVPGNQTNAKTAKRTKKDRSVSVEKTDVVGMQRFLSMNFDPVTQSPKAPKPKKGKTNLKHLKSKSLTSVNAPSPGRKSSSEAVKGRSLFTPDSDIAAKVGTFGRPVADSARTADINSRVLENQDRDGDYDPFPVYPSRKNDVKLKADITKAEKTSTTRNKLPVTRQDPLTSYKTAAGLTKSAPAKFHFNQSLFSNADAQTDFHRDVCKTYLEKKEMDEPSMTHPFMSTKKPNGRRAFADKDQSYAMPDFPFGNAGMSVCERSEKGKRQKQHKGKNSSALEEINAALIQPVLTSLDGLATMTARPVAGFDLSSRMSSAKMTNVFLENLNDPIQPKLPKCDSSATAPLPSAKNSKNVIDSAGEKRRRPQAQPINANAVLLEEQMRRYEMALDRYRERSRKEKGHGSAWDKKDFRKRSNKNKRKGLKRDKSKSPIFKNLPGDS